MLAINEVSTGIYVLETQKVTPYTHQLHVDGDRVGVWENFNKSYIGNNALQNFDQYLDPTGTPYTSLAALLTDLNTFFFDVSQGGGGETWDGTVDTFADLPSAAANTGAIYLVRQRTGSQLTFNLRRSGFYESNGTTWEKISQVQFMFTDDELTFKDDADNTKQLGFQLSGISTGTRRIITWQDKDYTPADEADLQQEVTNRTNADSALQLQITQNSNDVATNAGNIAVNAAAIAQEILDRQAGDQGTVGIHGDVDLTGLTISTEAILKWNGSAFAPALVRIFRNPNLIQNAANNSPLTVLNFQLDVQRLISHAIEVSFGAFSGANNRRIQVTATLDGSSINSGLAGNVIYDKEDKDVNDTYMVSKTFYFTPTNLGNNTFNMEFTRQGGGGGAIASIWDTTIRIEEIFEVN